MDSNYYVNVLLRVLAPAPDALFEDAWTFQKDNSSVHRSQVSTNFFESSGIDVMSWLAKSPDLKIIEGLWVALVCKVYSNSRLFADIMALQEAIMDAWNDIDLAYTRNMCRSLPSRLVCVLQKRGKKISY